MQKIIITKSFASYNKGDILSLNGDYYTSTNKKSFPLHVDLAISNQNNREEYLSPVEKIAKDLDISTSKLLSSLNKHDYMITSGKGSIFNPLNT